MTKGTALWQVWTWYEVGVTFRKAKSDHTALKQDVTGKMKGAIRSDTLTGSTHNGLAAEMHVNRLSAIEVSSQEAIGCLEDRCLQDNEAPTAPGQGTGS